MKRRQIARVFVHIPDDNRFARFQRRPTQALPSGETWIGRRLVSGPGEDDELLLDDLVDGDPAIIARRTDHFRDLLQVFLLTAARQDKPPDLLQFLDRIVVHWQLSRSDKIMRPRPRATFFDQKPGPVPG